ncbi:DNA cytosine methyltransferase, partial [uncultured Aeromicrobium sp.]|uniref:DNA cytosine methyltransferase n=1 Tax=uncultured Aeromicrobium sp. TaxID=337820 RepID=UPI00343AA1A4
MFAHHWPDAPNLGDISNIDWTGVPPVDVLCGGFPCQDVSTVGKGAGLAPGTRSGALVIHGDRDRGAATRARGDRERARAAVRNRR